MPEQHTAICRERDHAGPCAIKTPQAGRAPVERARRPGRLDGVVTLLNGRCGAAVGGIGFVAELLLGGCQMVLVFAGGLSGRPIGTVAFSAWRDALRDLFSECARLRQASVAVRSWDRDASPTLPAELKRLGLLSVAEGQAARWLMLEVQRWHGYTLDEAARVAPLALASGRSAADAACLHELRRLGYQAETPAEMAALFEQVPNDVFAEARRRAWHVGETSAGRRLRAAARAALQGTTQERK
jgi:hypothetical protein